MVQETGDEIPRTRLLFSSPPMTSFIIPGPRTSTFSHFSHTKGIVHNLLLLKPTLSKVDLAVRWYVLCNTPALNSAIICHVVLLLFRAMCPTRLSPFLFCRLFPPKQSLSLEASFLSCHSPNTEILMGNKILKVSSFQKCWHQLSLHQRSFLFQSHLNLSSSFWISVYDNYFVRNWAPLLIEATLRCNVILRHYRTSLLSDKGYHCIHSE